MKVQSRSVTALIMEHGLLKIEDVMHHVMIQLLPAPKRVDQKSTEPKRSPVPLRPLKPLKGYVVATH